MPETREDSVYLAKLAEQAERYEGKLTIMPRLYNSSQSFRNG
jgi:14-3-3 protein epsilon